MIDLINIQNELKAPKGKYNSFGNFRYRSAEDILEAVKPLLKRYGCLLTISDEIVLVGDKYFVRSSATFVSSTGKSITVTGVAAHDFEKKGSDPAQKSGSAASYARKYALSGLFLLDDEQDPDAVAPITPQVQQRPPAFPQMGAIMQPPMAGKS